jgi:hypothetical protein
MPIEHAFTYMVHPGRSDPDATKITGASVPLSGKLFGLLSDVYEKADRECDIDIEFKSGGKKDNACRDLITAFAAQPSVESGRAIAHRLASVTTHRSGLGLLFLILGKEGDAYKLLISRFPADSAILAEEKQSTLSVEFLERVFMKSAHSYKAALYKHVSIDAGFWLGSAVDKQITSPSVLASEYWVSAFLSSDFKTTSAQGTKRLATALRAAVRFASDPDVKHELVSATTLAKNLGGQVLSIADIRSKFSLSDAAYEAIKSSLKNPETLEEKFKFDFEEFSNQIAYRSVTLDTGVTISAPTKSFTNSVKEENIDGSAMRFTTQGKVIDERLKSAGQVNAPGA